MVKISLANKLQTEKVLQSGLVVSSTLVDRLEVYGYLNSCVGEDIVKNGYINRYNNFINVQTIGEIICAGYLMQPAIVSDNGRGKFETKMHQVYSALELAKEEIKYDLADLDIPSLYYNLVYVGIRKKNHKIDCPDYRIKNWVWMFPDNIKKKSDASLEFDYISKVGEVLCRDKDGAVKGIGEHLMALCRYLAPQTGLMYYAQFDLDELYVEETK